MLEVENLSCGYGKEPVVRDVSFTLSPGERLTVLGPNGCGKTTLLRGLMGILPVTGSVRLEGRDLKTMTPRERGRALAMLTQTRSAPFPYTVLETVLMGRYPHLGRGLFSRPGPEDERIAREALESLGLWAQRERPITELSGGQLQRVMLARTFAQSPGVILLDEPANHLDLKYQAELIDELRRWTGGPHRAALGVFHDLDLALAFADRVLLLDRGRTAYLGPARELDPNLLSRVFGLDIPAYRRAAQERWERLGG